MGLLVYSFNGSMVHLGHSFIGITDRALGILLTRLKHDQCNHIQTRLPV
jgi:hypothetical protein